MNSNVLRTLRRHAIVSVIVFIILFVFWLSRPELIGASRFWKAFGDGAFVLLAITLMIGPLAKLFPLKFAKFISWRRETGIWTALIAMMHNATIQTFLLNGNIMSILGYTLIGENYVHTDPGFGLANIIGIMALTMLLILLATSSNYAVNLLGNKGWKFLHMGAYTIFYLVFLHVAYFIFMRGSWTNNWFALPFVIISFTVVMLQTLAFIKVVRMDKKRNG
jgi:methionine sulfoxide reductase heme-binding subunit